jgi:hypothetical protein
VGKKYKNDPDAQVHLSSLPVTEGHILRSQAVELVHQLKGDVTAAEYYAIVASFLDANQQAGLEDLVEEGLDRQPRVMGAIRTELWRLRRSMAAGHPGAGA